jgi:hypothetical protein
MVNSIIDDVAGKSIHEWAQAWWQWFLSLDEEKNPGYSTSEYISIERDKQGEGLIGWAPNTKNQVWFLSGAHGRASTVRSRIPEGDWCILVPAYVTIGSVAEFPHLKKSEIETLVRNDVDAVGRTVNEAKRKRNVKAVVDGKDYSDKLRRADKSDWFMVRGIPKENVLDLDLDSKNDTIEIFADGYFLFLDALTPGDHMLTISGKAPNYTIETIFNLSVTGGPKSSSFLQKRKSRLTKRH